MKRLKLHEEAISIAKEGAQEIARNAMESEAWLFG